MVQLLILLVVLVLVLSIPYYVYGPVAAKAGFSKWWSLLMIVPVVNVLLVWVFAYIQWPVNGRPSLSSK
jgi:hypothetical protein